MTVIRPNSISGITSLTAHRGSINFYAHDGSAARFDNINSNVTSGVSTFASLNITGDLDVGGALTYEDVTNVDSIGVVTARNGIDVTGGTVTITTGANSASPAGSGDNLVIKDSNGCGLSILSGNGNSQNIYLGSVSDNDAVRLEGFYNSGSPYFNIYTGGSQRLRITSGGSVGFNTTFTQSSKTVHIAGDYRTITQNVADEGLIFQSFGTASTGDVYPGISWSGNPTALGRARASINAIATNDNNGSDIVFLTRNAADGTELDVTDDEKLRITSAGKVGIRTDAPKQVLSVVGRANFDHNGDYYGAWIDGDSTGSSSFNVGVWHNAGGTMRNEGSHLVLETKNTSHWIQLQPSGGNISVGSNNPNGLLALTAASGRLLTLRNSTTGSGSGDGSYLALNGSDFQIANAESANVILYTGDTERLRIASDGQVYIGSSSDNSNSFSDAGTFFNLKNDTYGGRIGFSNNTATAGVSLMEQFAYWGNNKISGIVATAGSDTANKDDGDLRFYTRTSGQAVTERLRINQAGCLQVGEPSGTPGEVMQIRKASGDVEVITYANTGYKSIFNCTGSNRFALERGYNSVFEIDDPNGNGVRSDLRFDGNIILHKNLGDTNNSAVQLYRLIGPQNLSLANGMAIVGSQTDTMSTKAARIMTSNNSGTAWFGPYGAIHPGSYTAMFHMKVSNNSNTNTFIRIDVTGPGCTDAGGYGAHRPRSLNLAPSHFDNSDRYQYIGLDFNFVNAVGSNTIEVRGLNFNNGRGADLYLDHILIVPRIPSHDG